MNNVSCWKRHTCACISIIAMYSITTLIISSDESNSDYSYYDITNSNTNPVLGRVEIYLCAALEQTTTLVQFISFLYAADFKLCSRLDVLSRFMLAGRSTFHISHCQKSSPIASYGPFSGDRVDISCINKAQYSRTEKSFLLAKPP